MLIRVVPTEGSELVLEFRSGDVRLFACSTARLDRELPGPDWAALSYPETFKHLTFDADGVRWPGGQALDAGHLLAGSSPLSGPERERSQLRVAMRNQAPTPDHPTHHVYFVYLVPYGRKPFLIGESIHGGHGERGGAASLSWAELLARPGWQEHFELAGCGWAIPLLDADGSTDRDRIDAVVREVCRRAGTDESDVAGYEAKRRGTGQPSAASIADRKSGPAPI